MASSEKGGDLGMSKLVLVFIMVFGLMATGEYAFGYDTYQWVDEKGTVNFSDNPTPRSGSYELKPLVQEDSQAITKKLSFGNRQIPKDQLRYYYMTSPNTPEGRKSVPQPRSVSAKSSSSGSSSGSGGSTVNRRSSGITFPARRSS